MFWKYLTEEFRTIEGYLIKNIIFFMVSPLLMFIAMGAAMHARCYMLFVGRCY